MLWDRLTSWENLWEAWNRVAGKSNTAGVDGITLHVFEREVTDHLMDLQRDLKEDLYAPMPVKKITIEKSPGKKREIGILTVRDRIVHQALLQVLDPIFEPRFLDNCYAYRPGRSGLQLVKDIENKLKEGYKWSLKMDIDSFFDTMDHVLLLGELCKEIDEVEVLNLVEKSLKAHVFDDMSLELKEEGTVQGSSLSPLLSNIYLNPFDRAAFAQGFCYYRYSDDLLFLAKTKGEILRARNFALKHIADLKLSFRKDKITIKDVDEEELTFVGYSFKSGKKAVSNKAITSWRERIEAILQQELTFSEKLGKLEEFWVGWKNYYPEEVEASLPRPYLEALYMGRDLKNKEEDTRKINPEHLFYYDGYIHWSLYCFFALYWLEKDSYFLSLLHLSKAYSQMENPAPVINVFEDYFKPKGLEEEALEKLSSHFSSLEEEDILGAVDYFAERGHYFLSQEGTKLLSQLQSESKEGSFKTEVSSKTRKNNQGTAVNLSEEEKSIFLNLFEGREGMYAAEVIQDNHRTFQQVNSPFTLEILERHLQGEITAGLYLRRLNDTVKFFVIDFDIGKKRLLQVKSEQEKEELLNKAHETGCQVKKSAAEWGLHCYLEDSGYRGRHCWFFLDRPLKASTVVAFFKRLRWKTGFCDPTITWEFFPARDKVKKGRPGELIKLPLGVHGKTGCRGLFLEEEEGHPFEDQGAFLRTIKRNDASRIEALASGAKVPPKEESREDGLKEKMIWSMDQVSEEEEKPDMKSPFKKQKDRLSHFHPLINEAPFLIRQVVSNCKIIEYLVFKAVETHYLTHQERFTLLCVLGHLGKEGKNYLHQVISYCMNYNEKVTERYIEKRPGKPVSCPRIRENYQELTASLGCDCSFRKSKGH